MESINDYQKYIKYKTKYLELKEYLEYLKIRKSFGGNYNMVYTFNKLLNILELLPLENVDPVKHIILENPEMIKELAIKNNKEIFNYISKQPNYKKKFYHLSTYPFTDIQNTNELKESRYNSLGQVYYNPQGIWISCGLSWHEYASGQLSWDLSSYIYEIEINDSILRISNLKEFKNFILKYKFSDDKIKFSNIINWDRVKEEYDGLLICPYLGDKIWGKNSNNFLLSGDQESIENYITKSVGKKWKKNIYFLAEWYRHWDAATGVIWRKSGIKDIKLLIKLNTFDSLISK
jgi:hypothetical protein